MGEDPVLPDPFCSGVAGLPELEPASVAPKLPWPPNVPGAVAGEAYSLIPL